MTGNYSWKAFYTELADKLLEFKDNRKQLIEDIYHIFDLVGMNMPKLEIDGRVADDMDPFTIYSLFNRGITNTNRARIAANMKELWNMTAEAPTEFDGIPVMNNLLANFFAFEDHRQPGDIDRLWKVFATAIRYADQSCDDAKKAFVAAFDAVLGQRCIRWNLTVALYWSRPDFYVNLDNAIRSYLYREKALGDDIALQVHSMKSVPSGEVYLQFRDAVADKLKESMEFSSISDLSYHAFVLMKEANAEEKAKRDSRKVGMNGTGGEDVRGVHYWLYSPGRAAVHWDRCLENNCMMIGWGELGDISEMQERSDIVEKMQTLYGGDTSYKNNTLTLWNFANEMQVGDMIFSKKGLTKLVGYGKVTSAYRYDQTLDEEFANLRTVDWLSSEEVGYPNGKAPMKTLTDITDDKELVSKLISLFETGDEYGDDGAEAVGNKAEYPPYDREKFLSEVYMDESDYDELVELVRRKKNVILQGPPGVGKTYSAKRLAFSMMGNKDTDHVMMVQFHQSYSYEDFIMGYRPDGTGFKLEEGPFYTFCRKAQDDPDSMYFFIIDEINRGNISKIFGELFMLIEADKRGKTSLRLPYKDVMFSVPENIYIIGMMNTADRSLALIDYALRRRFSFWEMKPAFSSQGFLEYTASADNDNLGNVVSTLCKLNSEIISDDTLGRGFAIGHSYLVDEARRDEGKLTDSWLRSVIRYDIVPLLEEYWYDDPQKVEDWKRRLLESIR